MHELSIAEGICSAIEKRLGATKKLYRIYLSIGPLSGVSAESLEFWFSEISKEKGFGDPEIVINKTRAQAVCSNCKLVYEIKSFYSGCPKCQSVERTMESGFECNIDSVELEEQINV
jgi:hydrogenase nickel incorporation protein HypA/HybF